MALIYIVEDDPSIQEIETMALKNSNYMVQAFDRAAPFYEKLEEKMKEILGTRVSIQRKKNHKGKIEIEYYSNDELERIIELISSIH